MHLERSGGRRLCGVCESVAKCWLALGCGGRCDLLGLYTYLLPGFHCTVKGLMEVSILISGALLPSSQGHEP
jgi:hypothetical protein